MANISNYLSAALIKSVFQNTSYTPPTTLSIGLLSTGAVASDTGTQIYSGSGGTGKEAAATASGSGYARQAVTGNSTNFPATLGSVSNNSAITWSTVSWADTVVAFAVFDASTNGNLLFYAPLTNSKTVSIGDTVQFASSNLTCAIA